MHQVGTFSLLIYMMNGHTYIRCVLRLFSLPPYINAKDGAAKSKYWNKSLNCCTICLQVTGYITSLWPLWEWGLTSCICVLYAPTDKVKYFLIHLGNCSIPIHLGAHVVKMASVLERVFYAIHFAQSCCNGKWVECASERADCSVGQFLCWV